MALNIPKVVQALFVQSTDASRVRDNIVTALQPVLDFLGQYFVPGNDGSLTVPRFVNAAAGVNTTALTAATLTGAQATINGPLTANGAVRFVGDLLVTGNAFFKSRTNDGFVVSPSVAGAAFFVTNTTNTAANFIVYDTGAVIGAAPITAPSFVSGAGFKNTVDMGHYYHTSYPGGQRNTVQAIINQANTGQNYKTARYVAARAGSVTAISIDLEFGVNARTDAGVLVNGTLLVYPPMMTANVTKGYVPYAKGVVPFAAGDVLTCFVGWTATNINACAHVNFEIELGA